MNRISLYAPRQLYFVIAVVIAIVAFLAAVTSVFAFLPISSFWIMTIAFVILALACVIKG